MVVTVTDGEDNLTNMEFEGKEAQEMTSVVAEAGEVEGERDLTLRPVMRTKVIGNNKRTMGKVIGFLKSLHVGIKVVQQKLTKSNNGTVIAEATHDEDLRPLSKQRDC